MWGPLDGPVKRRIQCAQASGKATACLSPHPALCCESSSWHLVKLPHFPPTHHHPLAHIFAFLATVSDAGGILSRETDLFGALSFFSAELMNAFTLLFMFCYTLHLCVAPSHSPLPGKHSIWRWQETFHIFSDFLACFCASSEWVDCIYSGMKPKPSCFLSREEVLSI